MVETSEEFTDTERLIISYIRSHPPEECMLDKITRGTSRSRATVLKYLEILNVKGILEYRFVGRSKLWSLSETPLPDIKIKSTIKEAPDEENINELADVASELHKLISKEVGLKKSIDNPDTIVLTLNTNYDIITANSTFETFFHGKTNLQDLINPPERVILEDAISSLQPGSTTSLEMDFMEKSRVFHPYRISLQAIFDENKKKIGTTIIGNELSQSKRTKRDLQTLLSITRSTSSGEDENEIIKEVIHGINDLIPNNYCGIFIKNGDKLHLQYQIPLPKKKTGLSSYLKDFIKKSMDSLETLTAGNDDFYLKMVQSQLNDDSLSMIISIPIISEDAAIGAILLLTTQKSVNSINIENVEIAADELSRYLTIKRLTHEKNEYTNTLVAMNKIASVLNSTTVEEEILEKSVTGTINSLGFEMGCIYLTDDEKELALKVHKNLPPNLQNMCIAGVFKDLFSKTLENKDLVYITSESEDYNYIDPAIPNNNIKTLLILPIISGEKIIGLLNMGSRTVKTYNQISLENLSSIGLQLGLALERSKLALKEEKS